MPQRFWLFKTEPSSFSITSLAACPHQTTIWDGVRNHQARNFLRDQVSVGDGVLVYHSRIAPLAVVGRASVTRAAFPDASQFDPRDEHFDPSVSAAAPRWVAVEIRLGQIFQTPVTRQMLRENRSLVDLEVLKRGSRLSIQPVLAAHFQIICRMGGGAMP